MRWDRIGTPRTLGSYRLGSKGWLRGTVRPRKRASTEHASESMRRAIAPTTRSYRLSLFLVFLEAGFADPLSFLNCYRFTAAFGRVIGPPFPIARQV